MPQPVAMTISCSDSSGATGVQADLLAFAGVGVSGISAVTAITVRTATALTLVHDIPVPVVLEQVRAAWADRPPDAIKVGMLTTVPVIRGVAALLRSLETPVVVDPMVGGPGGVRLLRPLSLACLIRDILPLATLVTLNLPDACALAGVAIRNEADVKVAARRIQALGPRAVLITGERGDERVVADGLLDGRTWLCFESSRPESPQVMDAGGALAAVTVAYLALGETLPDALQRAVSRVRQTASR